VSNGYGYFVYPHVNEASTGIIIFRAVKTGNSTQPGSVRDRLVT